MILDQQFLLDGLLKYLFSQNHCGQFAQLHNFIQGQTSEVKKDPFQRKADPISLVKKALH